MVGGCGRAWDGASELRAAAADPATAGADALPQDQIDVRVAEIERLEKVLQDAGIKLTSVASKMLTQSGRAMIEALIAGERDGAALAELAKGKMRPKIPELTEALSGHFGEHHAIAAERILTHLDFWTTRSRYSTSEITHGSSGTANRRTSCWLRPGLERRSVDVIMLRRCGHETLPQHGALASWAGLCLGNHESAGKRRGVHHAGQPVATAYSDRSSAGCGKHQGQLLRGPIPADSPETWAEQSGGRGRPQPHRCHLAHAEHRGDIRRSRRGLLHVRQDKEHQTDVWSASWRNSATPCSSPPPG